jgi:hypothetical protein
MVSAMMSGMGPMMSAMMSMMSMMSANDVGLRKMVSHEGATPFLTSFGQKTFT